MAFTVYSMFWRIDNKMDRISADSIVDYIEDVFRLRDAESYLGDQVTMAQHMLQT